MTGLVCFLVVAGSFVGKVEVHLRQETDAGIDAQDACEARVKGDEWRAVGLL